MTSLDAVSTPAPAGTLDRARVSRLIGSGIWLVFLGNPLGALLRHDDRAERYLGLAAMAVFVLVYLHGLGRVPRFHGGCISGSRTRTVDRRAPRPAARPPVGRSGAGQQGATTTAACGDYSPWRISRQRVRL